MNRSIQTPIMVVTNDRKMGRDVVLKAVPKASVMTLEQYLTELGIDHYPAKSAQIPTTQQTITI